MLEPEKYLTPAQIVAELDKYINEKITLGKEWEENGKKDPKPNINYPEFFKKRGLREEKIQLWIMWLRLQNH